MKKILVLNSGSSSIKIKIFNENLEEQLEFLLERIGIDGVMNVFWKGENIIENHDFKNHEEALKVFEEFLIKNEIINDFNREVMAIGHRFVNGGEEYNKTTIVTKEIYNDLEKFNYLAPLHNPANLLGIKLMMKYDVPNVIVCDTSFHQTISQERFLYPIPKELYEEHKIRKYSFHGISYKYILDKFIEETKIKKPNLIVFHLGNGCSTCAIKDGKSIDSSMGFTPLAGLMMGTRTGDIDPTIPLFLQSELNYSLDDVNNILNKKSGLLGISKKTSDLRELLENVKKNDNDSVLAFNMFIDRIVDYYAKYLNLLDNKIDGIIFTGGIGINSSDVVENVINKIKISNIDIKYPNEKEDWNKISTNNSEFNVFIAKTNEELEIAKQSKWILGGK